MRLKLHRLLIYCCCFVSLICHQLVALDSDELIKDLKPTGSITDRANLLPSAQEKKLRSILDDLNARTGAALVVVTLPSMEGGQIDDLTNRLFEKWGVGQAGKDNGAMLLLAVEERKMRIEVGYGLEGVIPDGLAGSIRDQYVLPYFRKGQMAAGIESGTLALANLIAENYKVDFSVKPVAPPRSGQNINWPVIIFILIIVIHVISQIRGGHSGRKRYYGGSGWYIGSSSGGGFNSGGGFGGGMSGGGGASGGW